MFSLKVGQTSEIADVGKHKLVWDWGGNIKRNFQALWQHNKVSQNDGRSWYFLPVKDCFKVVKNTGF